MIVATISMALAVAAAGPVRTDDTVAVPKPKKICKSEAPTGSRLSRRKVCRTAAEWEAIQKQAVQDARELQDNTQNRFKGN